MCSKLSPYIFHSYYLFSFIVLCSIVTQIHYLKIETLQYFDLILYQGFCLERMSPLK